MLTPQFGVNGAKLVVGPPGRRTAFFDRHGYPANGHLSRSCSIQLFKRLFTVVARIFKKDAFVNTFIIKLLIK
jgi:hypothetical protein